MSAAYIGLDFDVVFCSQDDLAASTAELPRLSVRRGMTVCRGFRMGVHFFGWFVGGLPGGG